MLQRLGDLAHFHQLLVVIRDVLLDQAHEHIVGIQPVAAAVIHIFQQTLFPIVPDENVIQMLPDVLRQQRHHDVGLAGLLIEADEIRVIHLRADERALAGVNPGCDGRVAVIVPLPLLPVQCRGSEHRVDYRRIRSGAERDHGAERTVGFGLRTEIRIIAVIVEPGELIPVFLLSEIADDIKQGLIATVAFFAVKFLRLAAHILVQRHEQRVGTIPERAVPDHVAGVNGKAVCESAAVQLGIVARILRVVGLVQPQLAVLIRIGR